MKMESGNPLNKLSKQGQKTMLEKQLDFQETVRPVISDEYYTPAVDYIHNSQTLEYFNGENYEAFPEEFRRYIKTARKDKIFGNGAMKVSVLKVKQLNKDGNYNIENKKASELIIKVSKDLKEKFGFAASYQHNDNPQYGYLEDSYVTCFPGKVIKNEKGEWAPKEAEGGAAKFFALLVARGLVEEKVILEDNMANLGVKGIKFKEDFIKTLTELKKKNDIK